MRDFPRPDALPVTREGGGTGVREVMRGLATLPPKVDPGAFSGQRQGWKTPMRTLWQCTASVFVVGVYCWQMFLVISCE